MDHKIEAKKISAYLKVTWDDVHGNNREIIEKLFNVPNEYMKEIKWPKVEKMVAKMEIRNQHDWYL